MGHGVRPFLTMVVIGAVVVRDRMGMTEVAESPIKASVGSSKIGEVEGIAGFQRFILDDFSVSWFKRGGVGASGSVSVDHLSG